MIKLCQHLRLPKISTTTPVWFTNAAISGVCSCKKLKSISAQLLSYFSEQIERFSSKVISFDLPVEKPQRKCDILIEKSYIFY